MPLFTKKHHEKIGSAVANLPPSQRSEAAKVLGDMLTKDNMLFNQDRFNETCEIKKEGGN